MDFFKFISASDPTTLDEGAQINGIDKSMWVERYSAPGEFSFEAKLSSGLMEFLPLDTLISHTDTYDIMIVENHEIVETEDADSILKITGRSFLSALENRIVGSNLARADGVVVPYILADDYSWNQIEELINDHINSVFSDDDFTDVEANADVSGTSTSDERTIDYGTVLERTLELLKIDDLGIKTIRKNTFGEGISGKTAYIIHAGTNHADDVIFTWQGGDVSGMNYLFTNKGHKTSIIIKGRWLWAVVDTGPVKYNRRVAYIEAEDIDGHFDTVPTGFDRVLHEEILRIRGRQVLAAQTQITINQADLGDASKYQYRRHFEVGDLISVAGNFGQIAVMRVVEYAEIEDENGESGHPTLQILGA